MEYRYVVVELTDGGSWLLYGDEQRPKNGPISLTALPDLLKDGWAPVRETPAGAANRGLFKRDAQAYCLVLLSKPSQQEDLADGV